MSYDTETKIGKIPDFFRKLEDLQDLKNIKVLRANLPEQILIIKFSDLNPDDPMFAYFQKAKYLELSSTIKVLEIDFETGEFTISLLEYNKEYYLTAKEKELIEERQVVQAIKEIRKRTNCTLTHAKKCVNRYRESLIKLM